MISYVAVACNLIATLLHSNSSFWVYQGHSLHMPHEIIPSQREIHVLPSGGAWEGEESRDIRHPSLWPPQLLVLLMGQEHYCSAGHGENHQDSYLLDASIGSYTKSYFR